MIWINSGVYLPICILHMGYLYDAMLIPLQHVLERGRPQERSQIISKLSGHIVQLSQHKFASNVVEKCLEYGDSTERQLLITEIVGHDKPHDNLLVSFNFSSMHIIAHLSIKFVDMIPFSSSLLK